jgi:hypothetical protein
MFEAEIELGARIGELDRDLARLRETHAGLEQLHAEE